MKTNAWRKKIRADFSGNLVYLIRENRAGGKRRSPLAGKEGARAASEVAVCIRRNDPEYLVKFGKNEDVFLQSAS